MKKNCYSPVIRVIAVLMVIAMLPVSTAFAYAPDKGTETGVGVVDTLATEEIVPGAISLSNFTCKTPHNQDVYVVETDVSKGYVPIVTYGENMFSLENVKTQAEREIANGREVYAAINTDFFALKNGESWGLTIKNGELLGYTSTKKAICFTEDGKAVIGRAYLDIDVTCEGEPLGTMARIEKINKLLYTDGCNLFNSEMPAGSEKILDTNTGKAQNGYTRIKLKKVSGKVMIGNTMTCKVVEIANNVYNYDLPKLNDDEYYIMYKGSKPKRAYNNVFEGDEIIIGVQDNPASKYSSPDGFKNCVEGVGIENTILEDGKIANLEYSFVTGINPRTVLGVKEDGTIVIACIDGRSDIAYGVLHKEAAQLLKDLGCTWGVNFDGGGSTTLFTSKDGKTLELQNTPSDGGLRRVTAGLCIVKKEDNTPSVDKKEQTVDLSNANDIVTFVVDKKGQEISGEDGSNVLDYVTTQEETTDEISYQFYPDVLRSMVEGKHTFSVDFKDGSKVDFTLNVTNTKNYVYNDLFYYDAEGPNGIEINPDANKDIVAEILKLFPLFDNNGKGIVIPYNKVDGEIKTVTLNAKEYPVSDFEIKEIGNTSYLIISDEKFDSSYGEVIGSFVDELQIKFANNDEFKVNLLAFSTAFKGSDVVLFDENRDIVSAEITYEADKVSVSIDKNVEGAYVILNTSNEYQLFADANLSKVITDKVNFKENTTVIYAKSSKDEVREITIKKDVTPIKFTDVPSDKWYASYLGTVNNKGLITGYDYDAETNTAKFEPEKNATRTEGFVFVLRMLGIDSTQFSDVELPFVDYDVDSSANAWSKNYIKAAYGLGLVKGVDNGNGLELNGNGNISRGEFFAVYARALMISDKSEDHKDTTFDKFNDKSDIERLTWFENEFKYLIHKGIVEGDDSGRMLPNSNVQRCHIVKMLALS